jgi:hypothetical protein
MTRRDVLTFALITTAFAAGSAPARPVLEPSQQDIDMGEFKVGVKRQRVVTIKNTTNMNVTIDRLVPSCTCLSPAVDNHVIPPGRSMNLRVAIERQYPGEFSYAVVVLPKDGQKNDPLKIRVHGEARSSVSAQVGWRRGVLQDVTYPNPVELGVRPRSSVFPIVRMTSLEGLDLGNAVADVNSLHFGLDEVTPEFSICPDGETATTRCCRRVTLALRPKKPLKQGRLQDLFEITPCDGSKVYIPILWRMVGDVYLEEETIHLGQLAHASEHRLRISFTEKTRQWKAVPWEGAGLLYEAIVIRETGDTQTNSIPLVLSVDQTKLSQLPPGYLFCRVRLYDDPNDAGLTVFINGVH